MEHHRIDGTKFRPSLTPPQFTRLPWNTFTFSATYTTSTGSTNEIDITVGNIRTQIVSRMGLSGAPGRICLKIVRGAAWNVATGSGLAEPYLNGFFYEITPAASNYAFRSDQADHGTLQRPARLGYLYPARDRKEILTSTEDDYVLAKIKSVPNTANGNITVRFGVLWLCTANDASIRQPAFAWAKDKEASDQELEPMRLLAIE